MDNAVEWFGHAEGGAGNPQGRGGPLATIVDYDGKPQERRASPEGTLSAIESITSPLPPALSVEVSFCQRHAGTDSPSGNSMARCLEAVAFPVGRD